MTHKREGAQRHQCAKGKGPEDAGCRGNCWYLMGGRSHASALSSPLSHSWTSPSRTFPPRPAGRFFFFERAVLYMAWLWILFICHLRPLDAFPAFLLERGLQRNVWEMTLDLFSDSAPEKCTIPDFSFFRTSPACLVRLRIQILRQSLIAEWIGRTFRTVRSLKTPDTLTTSSTSLAQEVPTVCDARWTSLIRIEAEKLGFSDFFVSRICRDFLCAGVVRHKNPL